MSVMDKVAMLLALCVVGLVVVLGTDDKRVCFARRDEGGRWCFGDIILSITN